MLRNQPSMHVLLISFVLLGGLVLAGCEPNQFALPSVGASNPIAPTPPPPPTPPPTPTPPPPGSGPTPVAYNQDIKPILDSDCVRCHPGFATYTGVLRFVNLGSPTSPIVERTRPSGSMFNNLTGDRTAKSELIRSWVFDFNAQENR